MITLIKGNFNTIIDLCLNIDKYYDDMNNLVSYKIECGCGKKGCCIKYGRYKRILINNDKKMDIFIQRVYCKHCKKTHSILPRFIIPYEREPFDYVLDLVLEFKDKEISKVDYQLVRYISIYKKWESRLKSIGLSISDGINKVITLCASTFKMSFMQNKMRNNIKLKKVEYYIKELPT